MNAARGMFRNFGWAVALWVLSGTTAPALIMTNNLEVGTGAAGTKGQIFGTNTSGTVEIIVTNSATADGRTFMWADKNGDNSLQPASLGLNMAGFDLKRQTDTNGITLNLYNGTANGAITNGGRITTSASLTLTGSILITNAASVHVAQLDTLATTTDWKNSGNIELLNVGNVLVTNVIATDQAVVNTYSGGRITVVQTGSFSANGIQNQGRYGDGNQRALSFLGDGSGTFTVKDVGICHWGSRVDDVTIQNYLSVKIGTNGIDARDLSASSNTHRPCGIFVCNIGAGGVAIAGDVLAYSKQNNVSTKTGNGVFVTNIAGSVAIGNIDTHIIDWVSTPWVNPSGGPVTIVATGSVRVGSISTYFGTTGSSGRNAGNITVSSAAGGVTVGSLDARNAKNSSDCPAGNVVITAVGNLSITGSTVNLDAAYGLSKRGTFTLTTSTGSTGTIYVGSQTTDVFDVKLVQYAAFNSDTKTNYLSGIVSNFDTSITGGAGTLDSPYLTTQTVVRAPVNHRIYYKGADDGMNGYLSNAVYRVADLTGVKANGGLLMVQPPDVAIANLYATNISSSAADLVGNLITGVAPVEVTCYWGTNDGVKTASSWMTNTYLGTNTPGILTNKIASGLTASTTYYFRFYAVNAITNAWAGSTKTFSTTGKPSIDNDLGALKTQTNATLRGNLTVGNPQPSVWIYWGTTDGDTNKSVWNRPPLLMGQPQPIPAFFGTNVYGLLPSHTYWYRCYASNSDNDAWAPASTNFTTDQATLAINDTSVAEGTLAGPANQAVFTVTLSTTNDVAVSVNYSTSNGTAIAGADYQAVSDVLTIPAGSPTGAIPVAVIGNDLFNANKTFYVNVSNAVNAAIADNQGLGTIINDDFSLYVKPDGSDTNNGATWATAFATLQKAFNTVSNAVASTAMVYVAKTTPPAAYAPASGAFVGSLNLQVLGGYNTVSGLPDGLSEVTNNVGIGLNLRIAQDATALRIGQFTVANFVITNTSAQSAYTFISQRTPTATILSNCVLSTTSTTVPAVGVDVGDTSGDTQAVVIVGCRIYTPAASPYAAVAAGDFNTHQDYWNHLGTFLVRDSQISASTTGGVAVGQLNRSAAVFAGNNSLTMLNSSVTNSGAGLAVYAGSYYNYVTWAFTNYVSGCTLDSNGSGLRFDAGNFSAGGVGSFVLNSSITARGVNANGLLLADWNATASDGVPDLTLSNVTIAATNTGAIGLNIPRGNVGGGDVVVRDSSIHGSERACLLTGSSGTGNSATFYASRSTFSAGAPDGTVNSTNTVVDLASFGVVVGLDRTSIRNGAGGLSGVVNGYGPVGITMLNSCITDQTGYGVRLKASNASYGTAESLIATNCTFSNLGGPVISFGDNSTATRAGTFAYCAFAPGANGGNATATNFVNEVSTGTLTLSGYTNAFYAYGSVTNAVAAVNTNAFISTNNIFVPAGDPLLMADGYHLQPGSPLIDLYSLSPACLTTDIDGETRPQGKKGDIGADEVRVPPTGTVFIIK